MHELVDTKSLDHLFADIGERTIVMLGEASHGTHEYYTWRTAISKRLIAEKGFQFIAVEGDWPDCYKINRYVKGYGDAGTDIYSILNSFDRWPTWMWANWEVAALAEWMRDFNKPLRADAKVGFYGLDVYSLWDSIRTMVQYLDKEDPDAAKYVRKAIRCFEPFSEDEQLYARLSLRQNCRDEVVAVLKEIRQKAQYLDGDREAAFNTEQNALITVNAERYYRSMVGFDDQSWNIRDKHMMETLDRLMRFHGAGAKAIVWEHNTHIGDARATDMAGAGLVNVGQLAREHYGRGKIYLTGFACYQGSVIAGSEWGAPMQEMTVPPAVHGSIEALLHEESAHDCYLIFREEARDSYSKPMPHRAIGVVYEPGSERMGNYVSSVLNDRYDALIFLERTKALHPVHMNPDQNKIPETYPFGL
jgi:erythromycin esterase